MAALPPPVQADPTLEAVDAAIEAAQDTRPRLYVGMSAIGHECSRKTWFDWRWISRIHFDAATLKRFADGHAGEALQAERLRMAPGIELHTVDPSDPEGKAQIGYVDCRGHFKGHMDGAILGLRQAGKTWHVWEHKSVDQKSQDKLAALKMRDEKSALREWNPTYYGQAVLYMHYSRMSRHYLTCSTPGGRSTISVRTDADSEHALRLIAKARDIIASDNPPARAFHDPTFYQCKWCSHNPACWHGALPEPHCRSCLHATPIDDGEWHCAVRNATLTPADQAAGCPLHLFIPGLVDGEQIDAEQRGDGTGFVSYRMKDGSVWTDGVPF